MFEAVFSDFEQLAFERRCWPGGDVTTACGIRSPTGWFDGVVVSPRADVAAARWADQGEAGFVLVDVRDGGAAQIDGAEWETRETNWIEGPTFSPDGRLLALSLNPPGAGNCGGRSRGAEGMARRRRRRDARARATTIRSARRRRGRSARGGPLGPRLSFKSQDFLSGSSLWS
jgi:hypothetical protein